MTAELVQTCQEEEQSKLIHKLESGLDRIDSLFNIYSNDLDPGLIIDVLSIFREAKPSIDADKVRICLERAVRFHHKSKKRDSKRPYVVHSFDTGYVLAFLEQPDNIIIPGVFHDVLEETKKKYLVDVISDIKHYYNEDIFFSAFEVSEFSTDHNKDADVYARLEKHLDEGDDFFTIIKIADNISNLYTKKEMLAKNGLNAEERQQIFGETTRKFWMPLAQRIDDKNNLNMKLVPYLNELVER
ncbi:hypothetical protein HQ533_03835 [Candidatus Woesearchaeota archaeon]|nr:hypothetical protein [Candidatus Woesearchaeota archaeon]